MNFKGMDQIGQLADAANQYLKSSGFSLSERRVSELGAFCLILTQEHGGSLLGGETDDVTIAEVAQDFVEHFFKHEGV